MTANRTRLTDRIRAKLKTVPSTREVPMFGGPSFMVNDAMVVAARNDGGFSPASTLSGACDGAVRLRS